MKPIFIKLFFIFALNSSAIEFAPIGAKWNYLNYSFSFFTIQLNNEEIIAEKDTIIDFISCRKLVRKEYSRDDLNQVITTPLEPYYCYQEGDKVFFYINNKFIKVYDFSLQVGNEILLPDELPYTNLSVTIDSIGTENVKGNNLHWFSYFSDTFNTLRVHRVYFYEHAYELIGDINYILPSHVNTNEVDVNTGHVFLCYSDNNINIHLNDLSITPINFVPLGITKDLACDTSIKNIGVATKNNFKQKIQLYPNPSNAFITIKGESFDSFDYEIYDFYGILLKVGKYFNNQTLAISELETGQYILVLKNKNQRFVATFTKTK